MEAVLGDDEPGRATARAAVRAALGDAALVDAAATIASFNAIVKIADGTGIPIESWKEERTRDFRAGLGIEGWKQG